MKLKVAVIGLGGIAQKAYLPVFAELENVEVHLYTRDMTKLKNLSEKYRFHYLHQSIDSVISAGVQAAFVHSSTASHAEIVRQLIENRIAVYVDKPISDKIAEARELTELAKAKQVPLMTGFNRRFAPVYQELKQLSDANMVVMQKNRANSVGAAETFIYDDFIHVVDTVRFLLDGNIERFEVYPLFQGEELASLTVQFVSDGRVATAIMNRDSGVAEEKLEVFTPAGKWTALDLQELEVKTGTSLRKERFGDWEKTLYKRGFVQIVTAFLASVAENRAMPISAEDALETHELCEKILRAL
ncbi:oxidoreductase [Listeria floridensis FSL S10-1187]|uniref:Oxidoreductase n=1 Tax=Listeria floridensis FSL S10-1187 TaxID=1265817 RepID=A0ABP3B212_9LIST|nr:Gfo/Idh/MocA family oxidoreductase [Listeria floridensis]EUJ33003.1 oxidoreductase [Listeria floridensis FSL S10-1187]